MSDTKLEREGYLVKKDNTSATCRGRHLLRQLMATGLIAILACASVSVTLHSAWATVQDDPPAEKKESDKEKEERQSPFSKDVRNIKEYELPEAQLKEYFKGSRAHRKQDPVLLKENVLETSKPTPEEQRSFESLRRQDVKKEEDQALIDKVVKRQVYSLSQPQRDWYSPGSEGRKNRDAIEAILDTGGGTSEKFMAAYKQALLKYLPELLDNHIWVRVNAMKLLAKLRDERAIKLFCDQIQDPKQHESVKFMAMEGLELLGQKHLITQVNLETLAIQTLLDVLAKADQIHPFTRQQAVRALGAIGRPNRIVGGNDVDVAVELLKIVRDPNIRRADRAEAAVLLANLQVPAQTDYNYQYVAYEIAQFAADVATAASNDPTVDDLHSHFYLVDTSYALISEKRPEKAPLVDRAKKNAAASAKGDPAYIRSLGDQVMKLTIEAIKVYKPDVVTAKTAKGAAPPKAEDIVKRANDVKEGLKGRFTDQLNALNDHLKSRPPRSLKLTPFMDELGPPPSLAEAKLPADGSAEEDRAAKDDPEANGSSDPGRSDP